MKKFFLFALLLCLATMPALANTSRVVDDAGLLSLQEEIALQAQIDRIVTVYRMDVAIVTKNGIGYRSPGVYAADFFEEQGYGVGLQQDGLIFLIDMRERDYFTATHGSAIRIFTDYGLDTLHSKMVRYLSSGDYYQAFTCYLNEVEQYLQDYQEKGIIHDRRSGTVSRSQHLTPVQRAGQAAPVIFLVALGIGLIVAFSLKSQLKTVRRKADATNYVKKGSFQLTRAQDIYLYTTTTRRKIETSSGSGGGSSTFRSSSGGSFGGRGGKF